MKAKKTLEHVMEVEMRIGVYAEFNETEGGGSWWEYVVLCDGVEIQRSANEYGNPAAAARDALSWYLGDL